MLAVSRRAKTQRCASVPPLTSVPRQSYTPLRPDVHFAARVGHTRHIKAARRQSVRSLQSPSLSLPLPLPLYPLRSVMLSTSAKELDNRPTDAPVAQGVISPLGTTAHSESDTPSHSPLSLSHDTVSSPSHPSASAKDDDDYDCPTPSTLVDGKEPLKESPELLVLPPILQAAELPARPYSAFSNKMKWIIALLCGAGAIISPLSSNIFVPAIPTMADAFGHTEQHIALGVSVYLIFQ